jgi:bacterioferritin-associated ferredoxin
MTQSLNPLKQFFRQPSIYLRLPSEGNFWEEGTLNTPVNKEFPVYPMTAIDEITYKTPDALYNGQAVVNVIQSCIPDIKDAWKMPSIDLNAALIAIRIASYGHDMELVSRCPNCGTEADYTLDLRTLLDKIKAADFNKHVTVGDLVINFQPMTYHNQNLSTQHQFEQQKQIQMLQVDNRLTDAQKIEGLNSALSEINKLTIDALQWSISSIRTSTSIVTEPEFIHEFITNCDRKIFNTIKEHIIDLRNQDELPPMDVKCGHCEHEYKQVVSLDQSSFFVDAS